MLLWLCIHKYPRGLPDLVSWTQHSKPNQVIGQYHHLPVMGRTPHRAGLNSLREDIDHYTSIHSGCTCMCCPRRPSYTCTITALGAGIPLIHTIPADLELGCWQVHSSILPSGNWLSCSDGAGSLYKVVVDAIRPHPSLSKTPHTGTD